jgi:hypothetical protein
MPLFTSSEFSYLIMELRRVGERRRASPIFSENLSGEVLLAIAEVFQNVDDAYQPSDSPRDKGEVATPHSTIIDRDAE